MELISQFVGGKIRFFRKLKGYTVQDLADAVGKSKSTVSKYEKGEIIIDVKTLFDIAQALKVPACQFIDYSDRVPERCPYVVKSTFSAAENLFLYVYNGHTNQVTEGAIRILHSNKNVEAALYFDIPENSVDYHECRSYYRGIVEYHSSIINFTLNNQFNEVEQMFIALYNPLDREMWTSGLICGLTRQSIQPAATRCIVSLRRLKPADDLRERLLFSREEHQLIKKWNALIIGNKVNMNPEPGIFPAL